MKTKVSLLVALLILCAGMAFAKDPSQKQMSP